MQDLKIGIVQTEQFWEDKAANCTNFERIFSTYFKDKQVDLILLPEMFNTGFSMNVDQLAETMDGESTRWLIHWAAKLHTNIAATLIIKENGCYYNRMLFVSGEGVLCHYDKRHLFRMADEHLHFTPGSARVIYQLKDWNVLLQTCYDLRFPVFSRNKVIDGKKEYDLCIYLANWPSKRVYAWRNLLQARAIENQAYCIGVNRTGSDGKDNTYTGDSMVINPWGTIQLDCANEKEYVKICTLESGILEDIAIKFPAFLDAD